ncbi:sensor histidine kinase [Flavimaricola marinus]|uniref:histidine kinase n=1 Tax=Flavimaricola marinus TaxID=1819565 RepID=A0A238LKW9_9RHOB|nr:sensor histidine kinase [Flavimaricola marinus]SMY10282.1 putative sensor histidine kinase pdtaS [Flavimaricola marinus]
MTQKVALHRRLTARVLVFLTLAMVPLGVIGVHQNHRLNSEVERASELSLLALTERAASGERQVIQRAFGTAQSLSQIIDWVLEEPGRCTSYLNRLKGTDERFAFVGFIDTTGIVDCSTVGQRLDFSADPELAELMENPRENIEVNIASPGLGQSVMVLNYPRFQFGTFEGYVSISIPLSAVGESEDFLGNADPIELMTFNSRGELLSAENGRETAQRLLPLGANLFSMAQGQARAFIAESVEGEQLAYTVVPIVPDVVYALGVWPVGGIGSNSPYTPYVNAILPLIMWLASLLVAWFAIDRFVLLRINNLVRAMRDFSQKRTLPSSLNMANVSSELADLEKSFLSLAEDVLRDEAEQEDRLREKSVLLKEVHHRVKNNLQIISSIMNMQIRKAKAPETKVALSQVQDRIMGLSGVHRTLYQAENLTQVNAAALIERIIEQSQVIGKRDGATVDVELNLEPIVIFPDQAVPLSMLVSEALTNAMKYFDAANPKLKVSLTLGANKIAHLVIENNAGQIPQEPEDDSTGLGKQLIRAFTTQLNGRLEASDDGGRYRLDLTFEVEAFKEQAQDY